MNQPRILVVEDEEYLRDLYQEVLSDQGYFVDTAQDGNDGMAKIKQGGWDLVMLDIILPGIDGISIMKQIKAAPPQNPNKKIIFLTNLDKDKEMQEGLALGDGYFIKSQITPGNLVDQIKTYINIEQAPNQNAPAIAQAQTTNPVNPQQMPPVNPIQQPNVAPAAQSTIPIPVDPNKPAQ
jgi:DNA-binding response OmpR family regulator